MREHACSSECLKERKERKKSGKWKCCCPSWTLQYNIQPPSVSSSALCNTTVAALAYCHSDHHHSFKMDTSRMLQWRDMLIVPLQQSHVSCSLWVTFFPSFHMMNCPPFERTLNVKKQHKFELICLLVDYLHICLSKDVLILLHRLKYLGAMLKENN